jgi:hypothetical protein
LQEALRHARLREHRKGMEQEYHLIELINKYSKSLAGQWLVSSLTKLQRMEEVSKIQDFDEIEVSGIREACCYRIRFRFPLLVLISKETAQIRAVLRYYKSSLGFMPVYVPTLNIITILKTWGNFADKLQGSESKIVSTNTCLVFKKVSEAASLSSLNFILRNDTDFDVEEDERIEALATKYFRYFYWRIPRKEDSRADPLIFYHDYHEIHSTHNISKNIFVIEEIRRKEEIQTGKIKLEAKTAVVKRLIITDQGYTLERINCLITDRVLKRIGPAFNRIAISGVYDVINEKIPIIIDVTEIASNADELIKMLVGFSVTARFDTNGSIRIVRAQVEDDVRRLTQLFRGSILWDESNDDFTKVNLEHAYSSLAPAIIFDHARKEHIYFLHPAFIGLMMHLGKTELIFDRPEIMFNFMDLVENDYDLMKTRLSAEAELISRMGIDKTSLIKYIPTIKNKIAYSKILRNN